MMKFNLCTWSALGLVLLLACGNSKDGVSGGNPSQSPGSGSTGSTVASSAGGNGASAAAGPTIPMSSSGSTGSGTSSTNGGSASTTGTTKGTGSNGGAGVGGESGTTVDPSTDGGSGTYDPPSTGGDPGLTTDPPLGDTGDPPLGDTPDPPPGDTPDPPPGDTPDPPPGDTPDPPPGDTPDPPPGDTPDPPSECTFTEINKVNVIVFEDATPTGADTEGRMWVGGDLKLTGGYAANTTGIDTLKTTCDDYALVVGGNITGDVILGAGKAAYGGTMTGSFDSHANPKCGIYHQTPVDFDALETELTGYSQALKDYPVNGTVKLEYGTMTLTGTDKTLNVFNVTGADLSSITMLKFVVPTTCSVIVNVSGKTVNWQGGSFTLPDGTGSCKGGGTTWCGRILYNMYEATNVTINGIGIQGSILAPYATFNGAGGNVDGQVIVKYLNGITEYHPYYFSGCLLLPKKP
jgi:choice-of-anchor A domain-containing protein